LLSLENVIVTPHTAFYSEESVAQLAHSAAANVAAVLSGGRPASVVNPAVFEGAEAEAQT
jgi:D-3-phosphoglycerate dehydrogenase